MYMYTCMSKDVCLYHLIPRKSDAQKKNVVAKPSKSDANHK